MVAKKEKVETPVAKKDEVEIPVVPMENKKKKAGLNLNFSDKHNYALGVLTVIVAVLFVFQIIPASGVGGFATVSSHNQQASTGSASFDMEKITNEVAPESGFKIQAKWGDVVKKMVDQGAIDVAKLENLLSTQYGQKLKPEWKEILEGKDTNLEITADNSVFMMYVLWALAKHNNNKILLDSPFAEDFKKSGKSGYDIGVGKPGYGDLKILSLTPEQQEIAKKVAENAYRPCCGQPTSRPDCSHGFSALGLIQLMASQGFSEKEMFDAFIKFNSFWFPANYIQAALYFKIKEGKNWDQVDKELVAGPQFSSSTGSRQIKAALQEAGV